MTKKTNNDTATISPLRQRMTEDMNLRKLSPKTQSGYIRSVKDLSEYLGFSPDNATSEDLRMYQLHLVNTGVSNANINCRISGLRFFYKVTLRRPDIIETMRILPMPRKIPTILNIEEMQQLLNVTSCPKYKAVFSVAYGAGLRISEVAALKVSDIDSGRMCLRVENGKGGKDRNAMLSTALLDILRQWWRYGQQHHLILKDGWLFPGANGINHITPRHLSRVFNQSVIDAGIKKKVTFHSMRHSFASHLLEEGTDIRVIQVLLGHEQLETTAIYAHVATKTINGTKSPLEHLNLLQPI